MENKEMMNNELEELTDVEVEEASTGSGMGTLAAMVVGSLLTLGVMALGKKVKAVIEAKRAQKETGEALDEGEDESAPVVEIVP